MSTKLLELRPDRAFLNPDFDGYKLSLQEIPLYKKELQVAVDRSLPDSNQYSLLHAKLFGLHNHLIGETASNLDSVYFIDKDFYVQKATFDTFFDRIYLEHMWQIPNSGSRVGCYNITMKLVSDNLAVLSDGNGLLYVLDTGARIYDEKWTVLYSDEIIGPMKSVIKDAVCLLKNNRREIHILLSSIVQNDPNERFFTVLKYVTLTEADDKTWGAVALRELKNKADLHYCYFEPNCTALYLVSDNGFKFTVDSEHPIIENKETDKTYTWSQTKEDVTIKFIIPEQINKSAVDVHTKVEDISVTYSSKTLLNGKLYQTIDPDLTTWTAENNVIEIILNKKEVGSMWPELVPGDTNGECILDTCIVEEANEKLQHLCSIDEALPQAGTTFNNQQVEECDFEDDKNLVFERIDIASHEITHRTNIGSNHILLTSHLFDHLPPALALRSDVDACLWQPLENDGNFCLKHEGTLLAFGYVQASKQQRKFSSCAPDLSYSVICDSSRHVFIYRQQKAITSSELRNRTTGRRIGNVAQQQIVNLSNDEILGVYATNSSLFLLTENCIYALNVR